VTGFLTVTQKYLQIYFVLVMINIFLLELSKENSILFSNIESFRGGF